MLEDKPLAQGCQVMFISKKEGYTASAAVDGEGKYTLSYPVKQGLPAVEYGVQFTAPVVVSTVQESADPAAMAGKMKLKKKSTSSDTSAPFPARYASTTSSRLSFKVAPGPNTANFKLEKE